MRLATDQTAAVTTISISQPGRARCACMVAQDLRLVTAGARQQRVDLGQHLLGLAGDALGGVLGHLAGQVDHAIVDGHFRQPRAYVEALDHEVVLRCVVEA